MTPHVANYSLTCSLHSSSFVSSSPSLSKTPTSPINPSSITIHVGQIALDIFYIENISSTFCACIDQFSAPQASPCPCGCILLILQRLGSCATFPPRGLKVDLHTAHWHGNNVKFDEKNVDTLELLPSTFLTSIMTPDAAGTWL